ncbi:permease [Tateyamaria omphalii]|uniref:EamA family transporter RarD n=1 Tax=Tateyamaria omphalii TaxID=299262 RepID=UPI00167742FA|nr:EamA family transporter RarD [Tateyamaria omphalii]GGX41199.1 permease [Tateyamaria omphalii]
MSQNSGDTPAGLGFALGAYFLWGFLPLYMKMVSHMSAAEVVAHRVIWSVPIAAVVLILLKRTGDLMAALRSPRMLAMGCVTAALVSINWGIYVWAIASDQTVDAALGYYINPLFSVVLGALVLRERVTRLQLVAIGLAAIAVAVLIWQAGSVPWVAVGLILSWGLYALAKKQLPIGPNQGFMLEVLILLIPAIVYATWMSADGQGHFLATGLNDTLLLLGCGAVTAVPLLLYANGAKGLRLTTIAILGYLAPTLIFLIAVFVFKEPLDQGRLMAFPMIWTALVIYSVSMIREMRAAA